MSVTTRFKVIRYAAILLPTVATLALAMFLDERQDKAVRAQNVAEYARLAATNLDTWLGQLLEITSFCSSSPALNESVDLASVEENCGRLASQIGAWLVIVETGEVHRQIVNTRPDAPEVLPSYARADEVAELIALEERTRVSGKAEIAEAFTGIVYPRGIVSTGQYVRLADGRSVMLYVAFEAQFLSDQLAKLTAAGGPTLGLVDASHRVVARSVWIDRLFFADAPSWLIPFIQSGSAGTALCVPGPDANGGNWDAGFEPLSHAPGWMVAAFQPAASFLTTWSFISLPSAIILVGPVLSGLVLWLVNYRDTAKRGIKEAQRAVAEAERKNREKSRLLSSVAHDIRSPLISLIGSLELIEEMRGAGTEQISTARGSAEALLQLIDDILELSFLGSGKLTLHPSPVDLRQLAATLFDQNRQLTDRKGLELRLEVDPDLPTIVEVDRLRLQQVLMNLLTNAAKYTDAGSVTLQIRQRGIQAGNVSLDLAVVDTGLGLAPDDIPRILREFGRLEREVERREQGAGLGLAIVQRILSGMGSKLQVASTKGKGSTFSFHLTLPIVTDGRAQEPAQTLNDVVILYAEDEPVIRQLTARRLKGAGAKVTCAADGEETLLQLGTVKPDMLLIDLQMPGLNGTEVIRRLGEIAPDRRFALFVLTSHISGPQAAEARALGADAVFTKPVQVAALAAAFQARRGITDRSKEFHGEQPEGSDLDRRTFCEAMGTIGAQRAYFYVDEFEASTRTGLSELEDAMGTANISQISVLAHRFQGLCLVMGASVLARQLRQIELAATDGDLVAVRSMMAGLNPLLGTTICKMRAILDDSSTT